MSVLLCLSVVYFGTVWEFSISQTDSRKYTKIQQYLLFHIDDEYFLETIPPFTLYYDLLQAFHQYIAGMDFLVVLRVSTNCILASYFMP